VPEQTANDEPISDAPAEILRGLSSGGELLCQLLHKSDSRLKPSDNIVSGLLNTIVRGIERGEDFSHVYPTLHRLLNNQEDRSNVVNGLLVFDDYRRAAQMLEIRNELETELIQAARANKLRPAERIVLLQLVDRRMSAIENRIAGRGTNIEDILSVLEKANYAVEMKGEVLRKKFGETSAQGREIVRKLLTRIGRELKAAEA
jgi:hypothetical protein